MAVDSLDHEEGWSVRVVQIGLPNQLQTIQPTKSVPESGYVQPRHAQRQSRNQLEDKRCGWNLRQGGEEEKDFALWQRFADLKLRLNFSHTQCGPLLQWKFNYIADVF